MPKDFQNYSIKNYPNLVIVKFQFSDKDYEDFKELSDKLDISIQQLIVEFFTEGVQLIWNSFEHQAKKKERIKILSKKYNIPIDKLIELKESLNE